VILIEAISAECATGACRSARTGDCFMTALSPSHFAEFDASFTTAIAGRAGFERRRFHYRRFL